MTTRKILCIALSLLCLTTAADLSAQKRKATAKPAAKAKAATVNFSNCGDIWSIAADNKNIYVVIAWSNRMAVIDKATGKMTRVASTTGEINGVVTHGNNCYYSTTGGGIFRYDSATGLSEATAFHPDGDSPAAVDCGALAISPDGRYLKYSRCVYDLELKKMVMNARDGRQCAVNNLGGVYLTDPDVLYEPLGSDAYNICQDNQVCGYIFSDPVTTDAFYCCEDGLWRTPQVPQPDGAMEKMGVLDPLKVECISRDTEGNILLGLKDGVAVGGKNITDPLTLLTPLKTGVKSYGMDVDLKSCNIILPDGQGNIIAASKYAGLMVIYNAAGLKGYGAMAGKATSFNWN